MVAPEENNRSAAFLGQSSDLSPFAVAVERRANGGSAALRMNSPDATLAGTGVREGVNVVVPNFGGQWSLYFRIPELVIDVVSPNPDDIVTQYRAEVVRIQSTARSLQAESGIPKAARIRAVPRTMDPQVNYVGTTRRGQARALAALILIGMALTVAAAFGWDLMAARLARRKSRLHPLPQP